MFDSPSNKTTSVSRFISFIFRKDFIGKKLLARCLKAKIGVL